MIDTTRRDFLFALSVLHSGSQLASGTTAEDVGPWPAPRADRRNTGVSLIDSPVNSFGVEWRTNLDTDDEFSAHLIVVEDTVYASFLGGLAVAVDGETGRVRWRQNGFDSTATGLNCSSETIIANTTTGELYAISCRDGEIRWNRDVGAALNAGISVRGNVIVHGDEAGDIHTRTVSDGSLQWRNSAFDDQFLGTPVIINEIVVVGMPTSDIVAFDLHTGQRLWERSFPFTSYGDVGLWPAAGQETVYVVGNEDERGKVQSIDTGTGTLRWERDLQRPTLWTPTVYDDRVLISNVDTLHALSPETGEDIWTRRYGRRTGTVGSDSGVYVVTDTTLEVLDPATGEPLGSTISIDYGGQPIPSEERIYVPTAGGELVAFSPGGGFGLWPEGGVLGVIAGAGLVGLGYWYARNRRGT